VSLLQISYLNVAVIVEVSGGNYLRGLHALSVALPVYSIIMVSFFQMARMHEKSEKVLHLWSQSQGELESRLERARNSVGIVEELEQSWDKEQKVKNRAYMKAVVRSFTEIQFSASGIYGIKWNTTLSYFYAVTCNTISILISIKAKKLIEL